MQNETLRTYKIWFDCCIVGGSVAYGGVGDASHRQRLNNGGTKHPHWNVVSFVIYLVIGSRLFRYSSASYSYHDLLCRL